MATSRDPHRALQALLPLHLLERLEALATHTGDDPADVAADAIALFVDQVERDSRAERTQILEAQPEPELPLEPQRVAP